VPGFDFFKAKLIASRPAKNWQAITVKDSGEYGNRVFKKKLKGDSGDIDGEKLVDVAIYDSRAGSVWRVRQQDWFRKLAERVIVTTTERLPSILAHRVPPVEVIGRDDAVRWCLLELECSAGTSDAGISSEVTVVKRRGTRAPRVAETAAWFRAEHDAGAFVISNSSAGLDRAMNHMVARGRNDLTEMDIVQFQHFKNPAEWERLEVLNAYLGVDFCVRLAHVDQFNQSAGRNCGFRGDRGKKHWVVVSPSLWPLLQGVMRQFSRYGLALSQTAQQARDQKRAA
jgi:hypothetical protein